MFVIVAF